MPVVRSTLPKQEWPVSFPQEPPHDRYLLVRYADGSAHHQFFRHNGKAWAGVGTFGYGLSWPRLVAWCMEEDLTLVSAVPTEQGDGGGSGGN